MVYLATLEGRQTDSDQDYNYISSDGTIYTKTTLGSYYPIGDIYDYGLNSINQLHGLEDAIELFGDELGRGFKFKMPKMKFKAPKMKFKAPKFGGKGGGGIGGMGRGLGKSFSGIGKGIGNLGKGLGKHYNTLARDMSKGVGDHFKNVGNNLNAVGQGIGKLGEGLLDAGMGLMSPGGGMGEDSEEPEETQEEMQDEQIPQNEMQSFDDSGDEMSGYTVGCKIDSTGKAYRFSPIDQKLVELSGEELGYAQFLPMAMQAGQSLMASQQKGRAQKQSKNNRRNQMLQKLLMSRGNSIQDKFGNFAHNQVQQRFNIKQQNRRPVRKIGNKTVRFDQSANLQKELARYTNQLQNFQNSQAQTRPVQSSFINRQAQVKTTQQPSRLKSEESKGFFDDIFSSRPEPKPEPEPKKDNSTMLIVGAVVIGGGLMLMNQKGK